LDKPDNKFAKEIIKNDGIIIYQKTGANPKHKNFGQPRYKGKNGNL